MPQTPEKVLLEAKVIAMGSEVEPENDLYLSLKMVFLTSAENLNHLEFQTDFIEGIVEEKQKYITMPIVVDVANLLAKKYDKLTHKFKKGKFYTQQIGAFYDFETNQNGNVLELIAYGRIWKRHEEVCAALEELYASEEGLKFSYECLIGKYISENGKKIIPRDPSNNPIGSCVVSFPAVPAAKALMLAEIYEKDIIEDLGGEKMERDSNYTQEQFFANVKLHFTENGELDITQVQRKVFNKLKAELKDTYWEYDAVDMGVNFLIMKNYQTADLMRVDFTVGEDDVTINEMYEVNKTYVRKNSNTGGTEMAELKELQESLANALAEIETLKVQIADKDKVLAEKDEIIQSRETEIATLKENVNTLSETVVAKDAEIASLSEIKVNYETLMAEKAEAEKAQKVAALKEKYSKLLSAEIMAETEIAEAIANLNESILQAKVTELALASAMKAKEEPKKTMITASRVVDEITISGSDLVSKYITRS